MNVAEQVADRVSSTVDAAAATLREAADNAGNTIKKTVDVANDDQQVIKVVKQTETSKHRLLRGYRRLGPDACKQLTDIGDLTVLIKKDKRFWYTLQTETIDDVLDLADDGTRSLCNALFLDMFGLSASQYETIKKDFSDPRGQSGIWMKDEGQYAIVVHLPEKAVWYKDKGFWKDMDFWKTAGPAFVVGAATRHMVK